MTETVVGSREIYRGRVLALRLDTIELENGKKYPREVLEHPGAVVAVPVDNDGNVLFVKQYRRAADKVVLELPAGTLGIGEDPDLCIVRELAEEINQSAASIIKLGGFYAAPGYCSEYLHCYLAQKLSPAPGEQDEDEDIEIAPIPLAEVRRMIASGAIHDAKTLAGLALALPHLS
jgi:ADP-ribose pyrophosphatase